ncbi:hypothetical protein GOP47_0026391 [Adiantum capillus-veneris]|nr:hypothetical protein GOP47_0026391 [Adiantum capillus-veneris]
MVATHMGRGDSMSYHLCNNPQKALKIIKDLKIGEDFEENCSSVKEELWQVLSSLDQRIFIYIDNILEIKKLEDFLPTLMEEIKLPKGSRLMLTTRDFNVCSKVLGRNKSIVICTYQVECLNPTKGKELLKVLAFGIPSNDGLDHSGVSEEISEDLVEKIVETCGGLPLAITVLAKQLYGVDDRGWERALGKLNRTTGPPFLEDQVFRVLEYCYDALDVDCRKAFVFVSLCLDALGRDDQARESYMQNSVGQGRYSRNGHRRMVLVLSREEDMPWDLESLENMVYFLWIQVAQPSR